MSNNVVLQQGASRLRLIESRNDEIIFYVPRAAFTNVLIVLRNVLRRDYLRCSLANWNYSWVGQTPEKLGWIREQSLADAASHHHFPWRWLVVAVPHDT